MTRGLTGLMVTASTDKVVRPVILVRLDFVSGVVRACTADRNLTAPTSGEVFLGIGNFGGVGEVKEDVNLGANGISLMLSGVDTNLISTALQESYQGRAATILFGLCDEGWNLLADPTTVFAGRMDTMSITSGSEATISMSCENRLAVWDKSRNLRYNAETQKLFFAADKGFEFVEQAAEKEIFWGQAQTTGS